MQGTTEFQFTPESIFDSINQVLAHYPLSEGSDRRIEQRIPVVLPITVQRLDAERMPVDDPLPGTSRNLSVGGCGFTCCSEFDEDLVVIRFVIEEQLCCPLPIWIQHRRFVGPCFEIGGKFEVRW